MPLDNVTFDYGGHGMPEKLTLMGVYKHQVQGPADYCAYGEIYGREVLLPEKSLLFAEAAAQKTGINEGVIQQTERAGKKAEPVLLGLEDIARALKHIDTIAPEDRPDPLSAMV